MELNKEPLKIQVEPKRYIVLLEEDSQRAVNKVEDELGIKLTSSKELNSKTRRSDIMSGNNGIVFKNLGIAVVEDMEEAKLMRAAASTGAVTYWEEEQEFGLVKELDQVEKLKNTSLLLQRQIEELEAMLRNREVNTTWGLEAIGLSKSNLTGKGIKVAVLDTGFQLLHPDFVGRAFTGKSFITNEQWDLDGNGHGTHCIGTALGNVSKQDGQRYGIAREADIVVGKVLSDRGFGTTSGIVDGLDWVLEMQCRVVSMSFGASVGIGARPSPIYERIGLRALRNNCLLIAAAGNDSQRLHVLPRPVSSPANAKSIMAVGALDEELKVAYFSNAGINANTGGKINVAAPGVNVFSSYSENAANGRLHTSLSGTSMATPHVAGLAALYCEAFPHLSAPQIWAKLESEAKQLNGQLLRDVGKGLVQAV